MLIKKITLTLILACCSTMFSFGQSENSKPVKVFILGGQSNMDGCGKKEELPESYTTHPENSMIWDNKKEAWVQLATDSFSERRKYKFGPEIAFSHLLARRYPEYTIAIVKTSGGGTKLWKHWLPNQGMYKRFLKNIDSACTQLSNSGTPYEIEGMLWMQGESDAETIEWADAYENNLKTLFTDVRKEMDNTDLPIIMGRISIGLLRKTPWCFDYTERVQEAQDRVAAEDDNTFIINTNNLSTLKDNTHFDTKSQIYLGKKMGKLMVKELDRVM